MAFQTVMRNMSQIKSNVIYVNEVKIIDIFKYSSVFDQYKCNLICATIIIVTCTY